MSDIQVIPEPVFPPHKCLACDTHRCPQGFVDFMAADSRPFTVGDQLYLCVECVLAAAGKLGWVSPDDQVLHLAIAERVELGERVDVLEAELEQARASVVLDPQATLDWISAHRPGPKPKVAA